MGLNTGGLLEHYGMLAHCRRNVDLMQQKGLDFLYVTQLGSIW
jgi:hypothetical protein